MAPIEPAVLTQFPNATIHPTPIIAPKESVKNSLARSSRLSPVDDAGSILAPIQVRWHRVYCIQVRPRQYAGANYNALPCKRRPTVCEGSGSDAFSSRILVIIRSLQRQ